MRTVGNILAGATALLFIITGVLALFFFNIERKAFSSVIYKQAFESQHLYERMPEVLAIALSTSIAQAPELDVFLKLITPEQWGASISSILPPEELRTLADDVLDSTFDYLNGKTDAIVISLLPFKEHMAGPAGVEAVKQILRVQPECTAEQLTQMAISAFTGGGLILCNPPAEALQIMTPLIETQLQVLAAVFPNEVTLFTSVNLDPSEDPRPRLNGIRLIMKLTPLLPLVLLLAIALFAIRSVAEWLAWWGWPLLITGGISLLTALFASPLLTWILQRLIQNQGADFMPLILATTLAETAGAITRQILTPVAIEGFVLALLGLVMAVVAVIMRRKPNNPILQTSENPNV